MKTDILIAGCGCSGLYAALKLPSDKKILVITKSEATANDSFLAQGGMCVLKSDSDYDSYFEDTMKAGHYENDAKSVEIMIKSSPMILNDLLDIGAEFARHEDGSFDYTREGGHSHKRIVYHKDITGKEITSHLLAEAWRRPNIMLGEYIKLMDIFETDGQCCGGIIKISDKSKLTCNGQSVLLPEPGLQIVEADYTLLATGGVGGLYRHSTNFRHLTGDGIAIAIRHGVALRDINYVQIHPTTLYSEKPEDRSFLISESVRGEGAVLYDKTMQRFVDELIPRDLLTQAIKNKMKEDGTEHVWEDMRTIEPNELATHFPNIVEKCKSAGYDVFKECIPVVPAQHYFMGGIKVDYDSMTTMNRLYAIGETACNGVHGKNRLASNSLLESMVFAGRAAAAITSGYEENTFCQKAVKTVRLSKYENYSALGRQYREMVKKLLFTDTLHSRHLI